MEDPLIPLAFVRCGWPTRHIISYAFVPLMLGCLLSLQLATLFQLVARVAHVAIHSASFPVVSNAVIIAPRVQPL